MKIKRILVVDDDPAIRKVAEISLSRVGKWEVLAADSGTQALEVVCQYKPDVILLDVMMPGMDGTTTFRKLQEQSGVEDTPVIFLTAKVQKHEVQHYCELGAVGVITKPFDPLKLPDDIMNILNGVITSTWM
ncbi:MAG TPA: response regulator [Candidatus Obscuribacterales bacterium]